MNILSLRYSDSKNEGVKVNLGEGRTVDVPWPCSTWHRKFIQEFLDNGGTIEPYVKPPTPVPSEVSALQAQAALQQSGYLSDIEAILADPDTDPFIVLAWNKAQSFKWNSPTLIELAEKLGISDEEKKDLFKFAATIEA